MAYTAPRIIGHRFDQIIFDDMEDTMHPDGYLWNCNPAKSLFGGLKLEFKSGPTDLARIADQLNRIGDADPPIPSDLDPGIAVTIANEQDERNQNRAVGLVKSGLAELKRRKAEVKDARRKLRTLEKQYKADKAAFIEAANKWGGE